MRQRFLISLMVLFVLFSMHVTGDNDVHLQNNVINNSMATYMASTNPGQRYILHFTGPIEQEWKKELAAHGVKFYSYIPKNAFIVKIDGGLEQIQSYDYIDNIVEYKPEYKVSKQLKKEANARAISSTEKKNLNILLFDQGDIEEVKLQLNDIGAEIIALSNKIIRLRIDESKTGLIAEIPAIEWIEPVRQHKLFNERAAPYMGVSTTWNTYSLKGKGQVVAVSDSGLDTGVNDSTMHRDFIGRISGLFNWDCSAYGASCTSADDDSGHGTHVTGSVLGNGTESNGSFKGIAYEANLVFQAIGEDGGSSTVYPPVDFFDLFEQAYNTSAFIHTNSWGDSNNSYTLDSQMSDTYIWNNTNFTILYSAGNSGGGSADGTGGTMNTVSSQCGAKNVICVGATENNRSEKSSTSSDNVNHVAYFSSRGPTEDRRVKPDVVAPGTFILSTRVNKSIVASDPGISWGSYNDFYTYEGGTSMATPLVAGAVALIRQFFTDNQSIIPSSALIKAALINGAQDIGYGIPSNFSGWGRVNITNSIFPTSPRYMNYTDNTTGLSTGEFYKINYSVATNVQFKATLVWADYPSTPAAGSNLVNDLNLIVITPNNTVYNGNDFSDPYNSDIDTINNVEQVIINTPSDGLYQIQVNASNVPNGPQPFALVVSGGLGPSISFIAPTPANATKTSDIFVIVNITSTLDLSAALLEWNYTQNITMNGSGSNWYYNQTNVTSAMYAYKVYGNDSEGRWGVSGLRFVQTNNSAPNITSYFPATFNTTINETANQTYNVTYTDIDGDYATVTWYLNSSNVSNLDNYTYIANSTSQGLWNITVAVSDGFLSSSLEWNITVINVNVAPNITAYYPVNLSFNITEEQNQTFNFTYDTIDNNGVTFYWYLNDSVVASGTTNYTFVGNYTNAGFYLVKAMVNDSELNNTVTWNMTVLNANRLPILPAISSITVNETDLVDINSSGEVNATDPDGESITYYYSSPINSSGMWKTTLQSSGTYNVTVFASDGIGNTTLNITVVVLDIEDADNDGFNDTDDALTGNVSSITSSLTSLNMTINDSVDLSQQFNGTKEVKLYNGTKLLMTFSFNFTLGRIDLRNVTINKQTSASAGAILVKGINLTGQNITKTVYMDNLSSQNTICIHDAEIDSLSGISAACNGANEALVTCNSSIQNSYNCTAIENGERYVITGLNNSGVKQQCADGDGDGYGIGCNAGNDCNDGDATKTTDCSSDTTPSGGGGGGSTSTAKSTSINLLAVAQSVELNKGDKITFDIGSSSHSIELKAIIGEKITLQISSATFSMAVDSGVPALIDVDDDGKNDIEVTATRLSAAKAQVSIKKAIVPTCDDGIRNQNEVFTDCGGVCEPCISCVDGIKNQDETGIDCGGVCKPCKTENKTAEKKIAEAPARDITGAAVNDEPISAARQETKPILRYFIWPLIVIVFFSVVWVGFYISKNIKKEIANELEKFKVHKVHEDVDMLEQYIEHALEKGRSARFIKNKLHSIGWSEKLLNTTLETCMLTLGMKKHGVKEPHKEIDKLQAYIEHEILEEDKTEGQIRKALIKEGWPKVIVNTLIRQYDLLQELKLHKVHMPQNDISYLENYIELALAKGRDESEIRKALKKVGWSHSVVHRAFKAKNIQKELEEHNVHIVHDKIEHLEDYIKHALDVGRLEDEIKEILSKVGWKKEHIEDSLRKVKK